jgi:hypothetical protein
MNNLDLLTISRYYFSVQEEAFPVNPNHKRLPTMELAIRILALAIVFVGLATASVSPSTKTAVASQQSAAASLPMPACGPGVCPAGSGGN